MKFIDDTGKIYGRLTFVEYSKKTKKWRCKCSCGNEVWVQRCNVLTGATRSCGCLWKESSIAGINLRHGMSRHGERAPEYKIWCHIKENTSNPNCKNYKNCGGRGIKVHQAWGKDFGAFYRDIGPRPSQKHRINRHDKNRDYEPGNCYWSITLPKVRKIRKPAFINDAGRRFTRLTTIEYIPKIKKWKCLCDCGKEIFAFRYSLLSGNTKSCGCYWRSMSKSGVLGATHRKTNTPEHRAWTHMKGRCCNSKNRSYADYGGRGIKVCERWMNSFENFLNDMGERPDGKFSIGRINNNGDYSPNNCKWEDWHEQANNRRGNRIVTCRGRTMTVAEWRRLLGVTEKVIRKHIGKWESHPIIKRQLDALPSLPPALG